MKENLYKFIIEEVVDGSTFFGWINLGFDITVRKKIHLVNIKCHDLNVEQGRASKAFVENLLKDFDYVYIQTFKDRFRKWNQVLSVMYYKDAEGNLINLNDELIRREFATDTRGVNGNNKEI